MIPTSEIMNRMNETIPRMMMPQMVASVYLKNSFMRMVKIYVFVYFQRTKIRKIIVITFLFSVFLLFYLVFRLLCTNFVAQN